MLETMHGQPGVVRDTRPDKHYFAAWLRYTLQLGQPWFTALRWLSRES